MVQKSKENELTNSHNMLEYGGDYLKKPEGWIQRRYIFSLMGFLGLAVAYSLRLNLAVGIVAMVQSTVSNDNLTISGNQCPWPDNIQNSTFIEGEFDWDEHTQGLILSSFFWGYLLTQVPGGALAQRIGGKWLVGIGTVVPGIMTLFLPMAAYAGPWVFIAIRVLMGLVEGIMFPSLTFMLSRWAPPQERSRLGAFTFAGTQFGTVVVMPISGILADDVGWESVFYVFGVVSVIWFVIWIWLISESPDTHSTISLDEREYIMKSLGRVKKEKTLPTPWIELFTSLPFWTVIIAHLGQTWGFYTLLTELPTYMKNILHFDMKANGFLSALPYLCMWLSSIGFSLIADKIIASGKFSITTVRKIFNSIAFYGPAVFLIGAGYTGCNRAATITLLTLGVGVGGACYSGFMLNHMDQSKRYAGAMMGITNTGGTICGIIAPYAVGTLTNGQQTIERWRLVFYIAAGAYFAANTFYLLFGSAEEQPFNNIGVPYKDRQRTVTEIMEEENANAYT